MHSIDAVTQTTVTLDTFHWEWTLSSVYICHSDATDALRARKAVLKIELAAEVL